MIVIGRMLNVVEMNVKCRAWAYLINSLGLDLSMGAELDIFNGCTILNYKDNSLFSNQVEGLLLSKFTLLQYILNITR